MKKLGSDYLSYSLIFRTKKGSKEEILTDAFVPVMALPDSVELNYTLFNSKLKFIQGEVNSLNISNNRVFVNSITGDTIPQNRIHTNYK